MHFKKYYYIQGVYIKLIFKNNLLRCFIYNYSSSDKYIACEVNSVLSEHPRPSVNNRLFLLRKKAFVLTQEITLNDLRKGDNYYLSFSLLDENKQPIIHNDFNKPFTESVDVAVPN